jgi:hypothetical protein
MRIKADLTTLNLWVHAPTQLRSADCVALARNNDLDAAGATKQPDGQITKSLSSPSRKNIPLSPSGKSVI